MRPETGQSRMLIEGVFPRSARYGEIHAPRPHCVRESVQRTSAFAYTERHLQCVWYDPGLRPAALVSHEGESIRVVHPGHWNLEAGPDFLGAALLIGPEQRRMQGDVEVHVHPRDWSRHNHGRDGRYRNVVAHVSYFPAYLPPGELPPGTVQCSLQEALRANPLFSFDAVDVTAYPYATTALRDPPCARLLRRWSPDARAGLLSAAGEERMRRKAVRMASAIAERGAAQVFYEELLAALGYKHNRAISRRLAHLLPLDRLRSESDGDPVAAYAILLGVAGLLPGDIEKRWDVETRAFVRALWDHWWKRRAKWERRQLPSEAWQTGSLRPQNHPFRRLAAAASLFVPANGPVSTLEALDLSRPRAWFKAARACLRPPAEVPYWRHRLALGGRKQRNETALLGARRVAAMLTNVVVPFLAAVGKDVSPLLDALPPEQDNALVRQTAHALFGGDHNPALYRHGLRQQGLIQIFFDMCIASRNHCDACRLVEWIKGHGQGADPDPAGTS